MSRGDRGEIWIGLAEQHAWVCEECGATSVWPTDVQAYDHAKVHAGIAHSGRELVSPDVEWPEED